jgi:ATP-dependent Lon protease
MPEIGLFPLGTALLPTEQVPLHIFEPRYRELIGECLERGEEFGLVLVGDKGMHSIGTRARVVDVTQRFGDGRLDIVVRGGSRFRLLELTEGRAFHTGLVEDLADRHDPAPADSVQRAISLFSRLVQLTGSAAAEPAGDDEQLSFALAARFELSPDLKQALLQVTSERERLDRVCGLLEAAAEAVERQRVVAERARSNGHVPQST